MANTDKTRPRVFLSSVFEDDFDGERTEVQLRKRIREDPNASLVCLWAYELRWPKGSEVDPDADTIVDRCLTGIKDCDLFVFLLTGRHGTGVGYTKDPTHSTYLELELFAAALLRKPVLVLHLRGREPEPGLRETLTLLRRNLPADQYVVDYEEGLCSHFQRVCDRLAAGKWSPTESVASALLPDWLSRQRTREDFEHEISDPRLRFLDGQFQCDEKEVNPDKAKELLDQVACGVRGHRSMPYGAALFRLWAAMRELMDGTGRTLVDPITAPLWDRAFGLWADKASWFGLHGHVWMGPLASIQSQNELRRTFASLPDFGNSPDVREPIGARASAIYSIAQRMSTRERKLLHYSQVVSLTTLAIGRDANRGDGALLIRGHALMQMARLGHGWDILAAGSDFKTALGLRERLGASPARVGEAMVDFGFYRVLTLRKRGGLALIQNGVELMRSDRSPSGKAFLARGLRVLEDVARRGRRQDLAEQANQERMSLAMEIEAFDQTRKV